MRARTVPVLNSTSASVHTCALDRFAAWPTGITMIGHSCIDGHDRHSCRDLPLVGTAVDPERHGRSCRTAGDRKDPT
ncbi:MAG TPA: hypothetical protein VK771_04285 [Acidimicrobiia bacterium]|nr:hypothetical protein [Acidimicrobiia bacterium]